MTFVEKRNKLIYALSQAVGRPVLLESQVQPEAEYPFIVYSVMDDYQSTSWSGNISLAADGEDTVSIREEQPTATFSFTACSMNREITTEAGDLVMVYGADEASDLAALAQSFFLHGGRYAIEAAGFVVVEVTNSNSRDALELDEMGRRYGFDVRLRYTRTDRYAVGSIAVPPNIIDKSKKE